MPLVCARARDSRLRSRYLLGRIYKKEIKAFRYIYKALYSTLSRLAWVSIFTSTAAENSSWTFFFFFFSEVAVVLMRHEFLGGTYTEPREATIAGKHLQPRAVWSFRLLADSISAFIAESETRRREDFICVCVWIATLRHAFVMMYSIHRFVCSWK